MSLPNVASPIIIQLALALGFALLTEAGLSFLGIGEQPPTPSWGGMLQEGFQFINTAPWAVVFPGIAIMLTVLAFNLVADGLRDSLGRERPAGSGLVGGERDPRRRSRLARLGVSGSGAEGDRMPAGPRARCLRLLEVDGLRIEFLTRQELAAGRGGRQLLPAAREDARAGRRERLGQDGLRAGHHGSASRGRSPG